jgi:hypothetical protein
VTGGEASTLREETVKKIRRAGGVTAIAVLASALTAVPAAADTIADFCPASDRSFHGGTWPPITTPPQKVELGWYAPPKDPVVEESVPFTAMVSRPDGSAASDFPLTAWSRSNPTEGYESYGQDSRLYGPVETGRWKIDGKGACPDRYYWSSPRPAVGGYPKVDVTRARTDAVGRARGTVTIYSNTRFFQNNVVEAASRHDPLELAGPVVYVYKRITRTVSDLTPAAGQTVRLTDSVLPANGVVYLQRWNGTRFVNLTAAQTASSGKYAFSYRPTTCGRHVLRAYSPYTAGTSPAPRRTRTSARTESSKRPEAMRRRRRGRRRGGRQPEA